MTYSVSGTITPLTQIDGTPGTTQLSWVTSNPSPSGPCGGIIPAAPTTYTGSISNKGNDRATATWSNSQASGSSTFTKNYDVPTSEITTAVGFSTGLNATVAQFRQRLVASSGSTDIFKGRQVQESNIAGGGYDNCWDPTSLVPQLQIKGSSWNVGYYLGLENWWVDDYIGWNTVQVQYYRSRLTPSSFPCEALRPQTMHILIGGTSGDRITYKSHNVSARIFLDKVDATRDGITQEQPWP